MAKLPRPGSTTPTDDTKVDENVTPETEEGKDPAVTDNGGVTMTDPDAPKTDGENTDEEGKTEETPAADETPATPENKPDEPKGDDKKDDEVNDPIAKDTLNNGGVTMTATVTGDTKPLKDNPSVKIRLRDKHSCHIGGVSYKFEKGKVYTVPENVKKVLSRAGLLDPL